LVIAIIIAIVCAIPFLFPSKVFAPYPLDTTVDQAGFVNLLRQMQFQVMTGDMV